MLRKLLATDKNFAMCTFGPNAHVRSEFYPWVNLSSYLPILTFFLASIVLGKNIGGSQMPMVYLITTLMIVQSASVLILTTVFVCDPFMDDFESTV
jgi:hypothetical protein